VATFLDHQHHYSPASSPILLSGTKYLVSGIRGVCLEPPTGQVASPGRRHVEGSERRIAQGAAPRELRPDVTHPCLSARYC
jgi:hypothetical protein